MIEQQENKKVKAVAYYLLPVAKFVSTANLKGAINLSHILINSDRVSKDILKEIQNSYKYRMEEILAGKLEETKDWTKEQITYEQQRENFGLLPMEYYKEAKSGPFNEVKVIKARK